jgi:hypothetical protein
MNFNNQLADLLRSNHIGLTTVIAIADAIAADARFNIWFLDNVKSRASEAAAIAKIDESGDIADECIAAIERFYKNHNLHDLEAALTHFTIKIAKAMEATS